MSELKFPIYSAGPSRDVDYASAGSMLKFWREMRCLDLGELAERADLQMPLMHTAPPLTMGYLIQYERGRLAPHRDHLVALERVLKNEGALLDVFGHLEVEGSDGSDVTGKFSRSAFSVSSRESARRE